MFVTKTYVSRIDLHVKNHVDLRKKISVVLNM